MGLGRLVYFLNLPGGSNCFDTHPFPQRCLFEFLPADCLLPKVLDDCVSCAFVTARSP